MYFICVCMYRQQPNRTRIIQLDRDRPLTLEPCGQFNVSTLSVKLGVHWPDKSKENAPHTDVHTERE